MDTFIENQNWRYATKKFDNTKKISSEDLEILKEAIRLSSSSYGLQPYKVIIVEASHLIVFANQTNVDNVEIDAYLKNVSETRQIPLESLAGYGNFMKSKITALTTEQKSIWTAKQAYLALANLLNVAAELKIDVTPMEGFESEKYNEILNLTEKGLNAAVVATIGYRHEDDETQHYKKVRKSTQELFINL